MIFQPTDPTTHKPPQIWQFRALVASAVLIVLLFGWMVGQPVIRQISTFAADTWHCMKTECNPKGPAAPWQDQISAADSAAHKIDPNALLMSVNAYPAAYTFKSWNPDDALEITFSYIMTNGGRLTVKMWDTAPANVWTDQIDGDSYFDRTYYRDNLDRQAATNASIVLITLGPRRALEASIPTAKEIEELRGFDAQPRITVDFTTDYLDTHKWYISYFPYKDGKFTLPDKPNAIYSFLQPFISVNTASGEVERLTQPLLPIPTP